MSETAPLNLDAAITREQYIDAVSNLLPELDTISDDRGWCGDRHRYFKSVLPEYTPDINYSANADFNLVPEDTDYAARLRSIRARVLWYAKAETINLAIANRVLTALGLSAYEISRKAGTRFQVRVYLNLNVTGDRYDAADWLREELPGRIIRALDGLPQPDDNRYVPGSAAGSGASQFISRLDEEVAIPDAETERPGSYR
jgi:hypothetical protein